MCIFSFFILIVRIRFGVSVRKRVSVRLRCRVRGRVAHRYFDLGCVSLMRSP